MTECEIMHDRHGPTPPSNNAMLQIHKLCTGAVVDSDYFI